MTWLVMVSWNSIELVSRCLSQVPGWGVSHPKPFVSMASAENSATLITLANSLYKHMGGGRDLAIEVVY